MEKFKCRASAIGNLVTGIGFEPIPLTENQAAKLAELRAKDSKSKEREALELKLIQVPENKLSTGAQTYLQDYWYGEHFSFRKVFHSKFTEKGIIQEGYSITQINEVFGIFATKNKKHFENDFIQGTPDIILSDRIIDVKNVYYPNGLHFFSNDEEKNYIWQIHSYNYLTGRSIGHVVRILVNPPQHILDGEVWSHWKAGGNYGQPTDDFIEEVREFYNFEKLPINERVRVFDVTTTDNEIKIINKAIELSREYLEVLNSQFATRKTTLI